MKYLFLLSLVMSSQSFAQTSAEFGQAYQQIMSATSCQELDQAQANLDTSKAALMQIADAMGFSKTRDRQFQMKMMMGYLSTGALSTGFIGLAVKNNMIGTKIACYSVGVLSAFGTYKASRELADSNQKMAALKSELNKIHPEFQNSVNELNVAYRVALSKSFDLGCGKTALAIKVNMNQLNATK